MLDRVARVSDAQPGGLPRREPGPKGPGCPRLKCFSSVRSHKQTFETVYPPCTNHVWLRTTRNRLVSFTRGVSPGKCPPNVFIPCADTNEPGEIIHTSATAHAWLPTARNHFVPHTRAGRPGLSEGQIFFIRAQHKQTFETVYPPCTNHVWLRTTLKSFGFVYPGAPRSARGRLQPRVSDLTFHSVPRHIRGNRSLLAARGSARHIGQDGRCSGATWTPGRNAMPGPREHSEDSYDQTDCAFNSSSRVDWCRDGTGLLHQ
jgi:hypothetical protein